MPLWMGSEEHLGWQDGSGNSFPNKYLSLRRLKRACTDNTRFSETFTWTFVGLNGSRTIN